MITRKIILLALTIFFGITNLNTMSHISPPQCAHRDTLSPMELSDQDQSLWDYIKLGNDAIVRQLRMRKASLDNCDIKTIYADLGKATKVDRLNPNFDVNCSSIKLTDLGLELLVDFLKDCRDFEFIGFNLAKTSVTMKGLMEHLTPFANTIKKLRLPQSFLDSNISDSDLRKKFPNLTEYSCPRP